MAESTNKTGIPLFDGTNFNNWRFRIENVMDERDLLECVETDLSDRLDAAEEKFHDKIKSKEKRCKNLIIQSVHDCQLEIIKDKATAKQMIDGLASIYERKSIATKIFLKKELLLMKYHKSDDMKEHFLKFDTKVREYKSAGGKMDDEDAVMHLLLTLPDEFDNLVTAIGTMDSDRIRIDVVKSHILDEFNKRNGGNSTGKSATAAMNADITCFGCGQVGHFKSQCKSKKKGNKSKKSWKNKNSSERGSANATESKGKVLSMSVVSERTHSKSTVNETVMHTGMDMNTNSVHKATTSFHDDASHVTFILDSGATEPMTNNRSVFKELTQTVEVNISVAKQNANLCTNQKDNIHDELDSDHSKGIIKDVLYVKVLQSNLMSVRALTKQGYRIVFEGDTAEVSRNGEKVFVAVCEDRLYEVTFKIDRESFAGFSGEKSFDKSSPE